MGVPSIATAAYEHEYDAAPRAVARAIEAAPPPTNALGLLDDHAHHCVTAAPSADERNAKTDELMAAVGRLMRRG